MRESELHVLESVQADRHPVVLLDENGRILVCSDGLVALTGWRREEMEGGDFLHLLIPPHAHDSVDGMVQCLRRGASCRGMHALLLSDGSVRMLAWRYSPLPEGAHPDGGRWLLRGIDLTSRLPSPSQEGADVPLEREVVSALLTRAEGLNTLPEVLEQALQVVLSSVPWLKGGRGAIFLLSQGGESLTLAAHHGYSSGERPRDTPLSLEECQCAAAAVERRILFAPAQEEPADHGHYCVPILASASCVLGVVTLHRPRGSSPEPQEEPFLELFANVLATVIQRFDAENRLQDALTATDAINRELSGIILRYQDTNNMLRESEYRFQNLTRSLPDGIITTDQHGIITFWNDGAVKIFGYRETEVLGKSLTLLIPARFHAKHVEGMARLGREGQEFWSTDGVRELIGKRKDGVEIPLEMTASFWTVAGERNFAAMVRDVSERKRSQEEIYYRTHFDSLTGLPNRNLFLDRLRQALKIAARTGGKVALVLLDLDQFKKINDSLGTDHGDRTISEMAIRAKSCLRESDSLCRVGGDEYAAIVGSIHSVEDVAKVVGKLLEAIAAPIQLAEHEVYPTASAGIAIYPDDGGESSAIIQNAETALRRAREAGRGMYQFYTPAMDAQAARRLALESQMRKALDLGEFVLFYQPKVDTRNGHVGGMEALVRWKKPEGGMISPGEFIPVAEESGLIVPMGEWILRAACMQNKSWLEEGRPPLRVAVNLSTLQFQDKDLIVKIQKILAETGLPAHLLELEITESMVMREVDKAIEVLRQMRAMGIHIAVDDFGTGYSSLNYLKRFPIHTLKVDQSFVREMKPGSDDAAIVSAIIAMAHHLNLTVVAEGVETQEQMQFLAERGCDEIQGYLLGRPMPGVDFATYLDKRASSGS